MGTVAPELKKINNRTWVSFEDMPSEEKGVGIEIVITLTIGAVLFIINGVAFLNIGLKKRRAQKEFRKNLEVCMIV